MSRDDDPGHALEPVRAAPPPLRLARSLQTAGERELVHIDRRGRVRSPARLRALQAGSAAISIGAVGGMAWLYGAVFGPLGVLAAAGVGVLVAIPYLQVRRINLAVRLMTADRLDEAEALLEKVRRGWRVRNRLRGLAELNLGAVAARRGDPARALEHQTAAARCLPSGTAFGALVRAQEILSLVNLDRLGAARARLEALVRERPDGEFVATASWVAELYLALAEDGHQLDADELHRRAVAGLGINTSGALLALLAWAHRHVRDDAQAAHLLREALDREGLDRVERVLPRLHAWIEANRALAAPPDEDL